MRDLNVYNFKRALPRMVRQLNISPPLRTYPSSTRVELDAGEPLQPLATLPRRARKRNRLYPHTKDVVPTALDREASHSCLSWGLYQREIVQALVPSQHPP